MTSQTVFRIAFGVFVGTIVFSLAGATLLNFFPGPGWAAIGAIENATGLTYDDLVKGPTWMNMTVLPILAFVLYLRELGWGRSIAFFVVASLIGAAAELIGTQTGFPFGAYTYGEFLGAKIAGHVPWLIPPSWYAVSIVALDFGRRMGLGRWGRIGSVALFMVLWDVALDPAMNYAFPFWTYEASGVFFGMPLVNWVGWALTSLVIGLGYELLGGLTDQPDAFVSAWAPRFYAVNMAFSIGVCFVYGAPLAGLAGLLALAVALGLVRWRQSAGAGSDVSRSQTVAT